MNKDGIVLNDRKLNEECGVFGIYSRNDSVDVAREAYLALYALQHRGQQSCGIAVNDRGVISSYRELGLVPDVFSQKAFDTLGKGQMAIGHCRYSTQGGVTRENSQPLVARYIKGTLAIAHNGTIINAAAIRTAIEKEGALFQTSNDAEVILYTIAKERVKTHNVEEAVANMMNVVKGAYSIVIMSPRKLIAARDPYGFRPLCMGRIGDAIVFASESCALNALGATFERDIEPGEVVVVDDNGIRSIKTAEKKPYGLCVFEHIYFARPDSVIDGCSVHDARQQAGRFLAQEFPVEADLVCGVPDSGLSAAEGYAKESGIPLGTAFIKNRYIGRTFIQPTQAERARAVQIKLNALRSEVEGKRIVLVDDSIVRGTTTDKTIKLLKDAGAKEVHMRISSPPFVAPCYFGTDVPSKGNLIACRMTVDEICKHIGADSLGFLSLESVKKIATSKFGTTFCTGCFTEQYPIDVVSESGENEDEKYKYETKLPL